MPAPASVPAVGVRTWKRAAAVTLSAGDVTATYLPELGMLGASLTFGGRETLVLRGGLEGYRTGHSTALPLLHPWANRIKPGTYKAAGRTAAPSGPALHLDNNGLPIHGTMGAAAGWEIERLEAGRRSAVLAARFRYDDSRPLHVSAFPYPHVLRIEAAVTPVGLTVTTTLTPASAQPVPVSFGYHPYFGVDGPAEAWSLRMPTCQQLGLDGLGLPTGRKRAVTIDESPLAERTFDDLFALGDDRRFRLRGGGRGIDVVFEEGYPFAQLYRPAGGQFLCIEPMTATVAALSSGKCPIVEPGSSFTARFSVRRI